MGRNGVHAASKVQIHREVDGLSEKLSPQLYIVLKLSRNVEFVAQIATQRVQIVVLLFDLHHRLSVLLFILEIALFLSPSLITHWIRHLQIRPRGNVQLAPTILPHCLRHLQNVLVDHPANFPQDVQRPKHARQVRLVQTVRL